MAGARTSLTLLGSLLALASLPACAGAETIESAHAVFMTRQDCAYVVANETQGSFAVLAPPDDFAPRQGDLLLGNLRDGTLALQVVPFGAEAITRTAAFDVVRHSLSLAEAQELYYGFCPLPPDSIPSPGLPLAPEDVPLDVPPDTTGTF